MLSAMPTELSLVGAIDLRGATGGAICSVSSLLSSVLPGSSYAHVDSGSFPHVETPEGACGFVTKRRDSKIQIITGTDTASPLEWIGTHRQFFIGGPPNFELHENVRENVMAPRGWKKALFSTRMAFAHDGTDVVFRGVNELVLINGLRLPFVDDGANYLRRFILCQTASAHSWARRWMPCWSMTTARARTGPSLTSMT